MAQLNFDKKWQSLNKKLEKTMESGNFFTMGTIYYEMANLLKIEGRDDIKTRQLGYNAKSKVLKDYLDNLLKTNVLKGIEILVSQNSCECCKKLKGTVFSVKDVAVVKPIPVEQCTHKYGCRCVYVPVIL